MLGTAAQDLPAPNFDTRAPRPAEPMARVKVTRAKFLLANGEKPIFGKIYELPRSQAMDLVGRQLAVLQE